MVKATRLAALFALVLAGVAPRPGLAQDQAITVFVVRHAEKGAEGSDPSLTAAGVTRAEALAHLLGDARVSAIFTSEFKRTRETAAPLAAKLGIAGRVIGAAKMDSLVAAVKALAPGSRALVVSHSNLVPEIVARLSGERVGDLTDADYDRVYLVTVRPGGSSVVFLHFGAATASGGGPMRD